MTGRLVVVLTGGPGGGKTALVQELQHDPIWAARLVALPEAISIAGRTGITPRQRLFQRLMVEVQAAMEGALDRALGADDPRAIICHRGTLDPLAYWLDRGWPEEEFFAFTGTQREEHYRRYRGVLHLVTAADGALDHYQRWPHAHRPESAQEAIQLDRLLQHAWASHPRYFRLDNEGQDWAAKRQAALRVLSGLLLEGD